MRAWRRGGSAIGLVLVLTSCASWQAAYLKKATNQATMAEVEHHLGQPHSTWELRTGETLWTYQAGIPSGTDPGGVMIVGPGWEIGRHADCSEYVLLFDQRKVLRTWMQQPCQPDRTVRRTSGVQVSPAHL